MQGDTDVEGQRGFEDGPVPGCSALDRKAEEHSLGREVTGRDSALGLPPEAPGTDRVREDNLSGRTDKVQKGIRSFKR